MESNKEGARIENIAPRTLKRLGVESRVNTAMEALRYPELYSHAIPHAAALSLLSTWDEPPLEITRALYFIEMAWGTAPGKNELLEIVYRDYLNGGASLELLREISVALGDSKVGRYDKIAMSHRHRAAIKDIIALYSKELQELKDSWNAALPEHQRRQHPVKFYRSQVNSEIERATPLVEVEKMTVKNFAVENSDFLIRAHHLTLKGRQLTFAMENLLDCYRGPTGAPSNFSPMEKFLGDEEKARRIFDFTVMGKKAALSVSHAVEKSTLEFRHAPLALNCHHLTLESMDRFIALVEEYNEEWALASFDWSGEGE